MSVSMAASSMHSTGRQSARMSKPTGSMYSAGRRSTARKSSYTASRLEMMQMGVPDDYIDALLDEGYMERLIVANDHLNKKRRLRLQRYLRMNKIIFVFLCMQSLLGIVVAFYKTLMQPDYLFSAQAELQNVDLVLMMDTAKHMGEAMKTQHRVVKNFTGELNMTMHNYRDNTQIEVARNLTREQSNQEGFFIRYIPFLKYLTSHSTGAEAQVHGGWLRIATGTFNAKEAQHLHGFTRDLSVQAQKLETLKSDDYKSSAQWLTAMQQCKDIINRQGHKTSLRYCVIIGDNEAMCRKHVGDKVSKFCQKYPHLCPDAGIDKVGNLLEYPEEMQVCTDFVNKSLEGELRTQMIMMFTVKDKAEEQLRLSNQHFRSFVQENTGCKILGKPQATGTVYELDEEGGTCLRFIMATNYDELALKAKKVSELLSRESKMAKEDNSFQDYRYLFFLILPLNLVFYIIWSKILRCTAQVKTHANRAMGVKKKMIKVTKTLVEKPRRDSMVEMFEANLTEVELAEVSSLRPAIECGAPMTLRARLKGGYLHKNAETGGCDGNGKAFDEASYWNFEPVDVTKSMMKGTGLQAGTRVKLRNALGQVLRVDSEGARFVDDKRTSRIQGGADTIEEGDEEDETSIMHKSGGDEAQEFIVETADYAEGDDGGTARLGDNLRVKCCATGKYIRVHKDGRCDGMGEYNDTETQMSVDLGGQAIPTQTVVALRSPTTGCYIFGNPDGDVSAQPGGDDWRYWMLERKEEGSGDGGGQEADGEGGAGGETDMAKTLTTALKLGTLKVGDVVTLKGINQHHLEVAQDGTVHCGKTIKPNKPEGEGDGADGDGSGGAADQPQDGDGADLVPGSGCTEFVVERVGMGTVHTQDRTVRTGAEICLKPRYPGGVQTAPDNATYLSVDEEGGVTSDGRVTSREIGFTLEIANINEMVEPISDNLLKGDIELLVSPLWNKHEVKRLEAISAAWTTSEDLSKFRGAVVVANDQGQYTVPKAKGESFQGWVAVVKDGVDIVKAAKQAKAQGATGIIIKSSEVLSMDKLARNAAAAQPDLPAVYMDEAIATALNERGINLNGIESKGENRTNALRSIGKAGVRESYYEMDMQTMKSMRAKQNADVFKNVGALMVEQHEEALRKAAEEPQFEEMEVDEEDEGSAGKGFAWKVAANTHYLWSGSGGGAARMNVNFGSKAPPSAKKRHKVEIATGNIVHHSDASQHHHRTSITKVKKKIRIEQGAERSSVVGVTMVDGEDLKNKTIGAGLAEELGMMMTSEQVESAPLEQLPDDSDYKIEYAFEEVEVAVGEKAEEIVEEELIDDSGAVVGRFAVPVHRFWMVAFGMLASTMILSMLLLVLLKTSSMYQSSDQGVSSYDENLDNPDFKPAEPASMMAKLWAGKASTMVKAWSRSSSGTHNVVHH